MLGHSSMNYMGLLSKIAINIGEGNQISTLSNAIYNCSAVTSIKIYSGTTYNATYAFPSGSNYSLMEINVDRIKNIISSSFRYSYAIQKIEIPDCVTKIGNSTFGSNYAIEELTFPASIDSIASLSVQACTNIKKVTFKGTPTSIPTTAFQSMTQECDVYVPWAEDEVPNSPWGLTGATIQYNYTEESEEE